MSVTTYTLQKTYRPALFAAATKELDGIAARLAAEAGKPLAQKETIEVDGQQIRAYRFGTTRIGFVFRAMREYELLCQLPADGQDQGGACAMLFQSFSVA